MYFIYLEFYGSLELNLNQVNLFNFIFQQFNFAINNYSQFYILKNFWFVLKFL